MKLEIHQDQVTICSFEITCAFDCHLSYEWVPSHNSLPSLEAHFMELEPHVLSMMGLGSWPGTVSLALGFGFFLWCRQSEGIKEDHSGTLQACVFTSWVLPLLLPRRGPAVLFGPEPQPPLAAVSEVPACHAQPASCGPWVSRTLTPQHTQRQEGQAYSSVALSTGDMVSHRLISVPTDHPLGSWMQAFS